MTAAAMSRIVLPSLALVAAVGAALVFGIQHVRRAPPVDAKAPTAAAVVAKPAPGARDKAAAALATAQAETNALAAALAGSSPPPNSGDGIPSFDVASIEPTGEAVIAGRAAPGATVELLRNGEVHDRVIADRSGQFAMVPPKLPSGTYDLTLRVKQPDGTQVTSKQSVAVAIQPGQHERPIVALMTPDKPTVVLSQPAVSSPMGGPVAVETVETEPGGKLHVSGRSRPGAAVRLYLNDSFLASVTASADGRFAVTINEGVAPGSYRVRLDEVEANSGAVRSRAEVPFNVPDTVAATGSVPAQAAGSKRQDKQQDKQQDLATSQRPQLAAAAAGPSSVGGSLSKVVVPRIATTTVVRGDSLWRISHVTYGAGTRYAVIYKANRGQIRNPDRIYPGQVFVLPVRER